MYQKRTLKRFYPVTRRLMIHANVIETELRRLKKTIQAVAEIEADSIALRAMNAPKIPSHGVRYGIDNDGIIKTEKELFNDY